MRTVVATLCIAIFYCCSAADPCVEGFQTKKGNFWFECQKGKQTPIACINGDGDRVDIGSGFQTDKFAFQCSKTGDSVNLTQIACINQGRRVEVGQTFTSDQTQFFTCSKNSADGTLKIEPAGCVGSDGQPLKDGDTVKRGSTVYTCSKSASGGVTLVAKACLVEGKEYKPDDVIESNGVWYKCEKDSKGELSTNLKGCLENKTRYDLGNKFNDGYFVFECQKLAGSAFRVGVGCVERYPNGTVSEYKPGDKWLVGVNQYNRYQIQCTKEGLTIRRRGIACFYNTSDGSGLLPGGCMKKVGFQIIQCAPSTPTLPNVRIRITENPTAADEERLRNDGMKFC